MSRQIFLWILLTYTYSQTCRAYIPARIEQTPTNYKSPMYDTYEHNLENIDLIKQKDYEHSINTPTYQNVIENIRNSWQMPAGYLQKRGYMKKAKCFGNNCRDEFLTSEKNKGNQLNLECKGCRAIQNGLCPNKWNINPENSLQGSPDTPVVEQIATTTTPKPGLLKKFKNLFTRKNTTSALVDELPSLNKLTKTANLLQNDYEQLNDYIALQDSRENLADWSNTVPRRSYRQGRNKNWLSSLLEKPSCKDCPEIPSVNHNIFAKDTTNDELLKNLSQTDLEYVKNFVKCFKENKNKFLIDYLHVNASTLAAANQTSTKVGTTTVSTPPASSSKPITSAAKSNNTTQTTSNSPSSTTQCKESSLKNVTIETSVKNASESKAQKNEECDVNNTATGVIRKQNLCAKNTVKSCNHRKSVYPEKLKFLAHLHHAVDEVGKPPHKSLNLTKIQEMINDARHNTPGTLDAGNGDNCSTPIRLNELSLDLEVGGASANNSKAINPLTINCLKNNWGDVEAKSDWTENDAASQFLEGSQQGNQMNSFRIQPPYAENFLDQIDMDGDSHTQDIDKGSHFLSKISKKREVAYSEDDILSDISSSLNKFTFSGPARTEHHHDDYYSEKNKGSNNDDDYYIDDELPREETVGLRGGYRGRKKKKNRRLHMRHSGYAQSDESEANEQSEETKPQNSETGGNVIFSDFDDIKFRMNPEQEKSIQTFIESLNSPPEIFSFDVDKFIKEPENRIDDNLKSELTPQRKFYEFIDTPAIENEQIPLLGSNLEVHKEVSRNEDVGLDHTGKRDLLRQYIKGVSSRLNEIDHPLEELDSEGRKMQEPVAKREGEVPVNDNTAMLTNFPKFYDEIYTNKLTNQQKPAEEVDDFVDKYYLLNDGSVNIYEPHKFSKTVYDPEGIQIDLDLNKKFKDLIYKRGSPRDKLNGKLRGNARY